MKKSTHFEWNDQADQAFHELKKMLTTPPVLAAPTEKEPMLLYIAATSEWSAQLLWSNAQKKAGLS